MQNGLASLSGIYIILYSGNFLRIKYKDWGEKRSKKFPKDGSDKILKQLEKENKELKESNKLILKSLKNIEQQTSSQKAAKKLR